MVRENLRERSYLRPIILWNYLLLGCSITLLLVGCNPEGDTGRPPEPPNPRDPGFIEQGIQEVLNAYQAAILQEDIDRLNELLLPPDSPTQIQTAGQIFTNRQAEQVFESGQVFREQMTRALRRRGVIDLQWIPEENRDSSSNTLSISFLEVASFLEAENQAEPSTQVQRTSVRRITFRLTQDEIDDILAFRIADVVRSDTLFQVIMRGRVLAGHPTRVEVTGARPMRQVTIEVPDTDIRPATQELRPLFDHNLSDLFFHVVFTPEVEGLQTLRVYIRQNDGTVFTFDHRYRVRMADDLVAHRIAGTGSTRFFAIAIDENHTVWGGGDQSASIYHVPLGHASALKYYPTHPELNPAGRVSDIAIDERNRIHFVFVDLVNAGVLAERSGVRVLDPDNPDDFCWMVRVSDEKYPFFTPDGVKSPSTRVAAADAGMIWILGSDGGAARVEPFQDGLCPVDDYDLYDRKRFPGEETLLANTIPAVVPSTDGSLWFGTALGLTQFKDDEWNPVRFVPDLPIPDAKTLEEFFQMIAAAIFQLRPISTVTIGTQLFDQELVKQDLIFSAIEDEQGRIWVGTLGGGLRCIGSQTNACRKSHITRQDGLSSNIIFAVAKGVDNEIWAATDEGVSRIREVSQVEDEDQLQVTHFSALDGLVTPVRDVAVDHVTDTVWLATEGGLVQLAPENDVIDGVLYRIDDQAKRYPVQGAEIFIPGTPFRTLTRADGSFVLEHLPPVPKRLQIEADLADGGPFTAAELLVQENAPPVARDDTFIIALQDTNSSLRILDNDDDDGELMATEVIQGINGIVTLKDSGKEVSYKPTPLGPPRLVSGELEEGEPGQILPKPFVLIVEDEFGIPRPNVMVEARVTQGDGEFVSVTNAETPDVGMTDSTGEVSFLLRVGDLATEEVEFFIKQQDFDRFTYRVCDDGLPALCTTADVTIAINNLPIANAGSDQTVSVKDVVQLDGSRSFDVDGDSIATYVWSLERPHGSAAVLSNPSSKSPTFMADLAGIYEVQLIVTDGNGFASQPDALMITAERGANLPPIANAGPDQIVLVGDQVFLDGSNSSDLDGDPLRYAWTLAVRPAGSTATLSDATAVMPTFIADQAGIYEAQLFVQDDFGNSLADRVQITANRRPIANAGPDQMVFAGTQVLLDGSGSSDPDGDVLRYAWTLTARPAGSATTLSAAIASPLFVPDQEGVYEVQLIVRDATASSAPDTAIVIAAPSEGNNRRPIANAGPDQIVLLGTQVLLDGSGSSDPDGDALTYKWQLSALPLDSGAVLSQPSSPSPTFFTDQPGVYEVELIVADSMGLSSLSDTVSIEAQGLFAPPFANAGPDQTVSVGDQVLLDGSAFGFDDGLLIFNWTFISRPAGSVTTLTAPDSVNPSFIADQAGVYEVELIVDDGFGFSEPDTVRILAEPVPPPNQPTMADAGPDQTVRVGDEVRLDGSGPSNPEGDSLLYEWSFLQKPPGSQAILLTEVSSNVVFTADVAGRYVIQLVVNDGQASSAPSVVIVTAESSVVVRAE